MSSENNNEEHLRNLPDGGEKDLAEQPTGKLPGSDALPLGNKEQQLRDQIIQEVIKNLARKDDGYIYGDNNYIWRFTEEQVNSIIEAIIADPLLRGQLTYNGFTALLNELHLSATEVIPSRNVFCPWVNVQVEYYTIWDSQSKKLVNYTIIGNQRYYGTINNSQFIPQMEKQDFIDAYNKAQKKDGEESLHALQPLGGPGNNETLIPSWRTFVPSPKPASQFSDPYNMPDLPERGDSGSIPPHPPGGQIASGSEGGGGQKKESRWKKAGVWLHEQTEKFNYVILGLGVEGAEHHVNIANLLRNVEEFPHHLFDAIPALPHIDSNLTLLTSLGVVAASVIREQDIFRRSIGYEKSSVKNIWFDINPLNLFNKHIIQEIGLVIGTLGVEHLTYPAVRDTIEAFQHPHFLTGAKAVIEGLFEVASGVAVGWEVWGHNKRLERIKQRLQKKRNVTGGRHSPEDAPPSREKEAPLVKPQNQKGQESHDRKSEQAQNKLEEDLKNARSKIAELEGQLKERQGDKARIEGLQEQVKILREQIQLLRDQNQQFMKLLQER